MQPQRKLAKKQAHPKRNLSASYPCSIQIRTRLVLKELADEKDTSLFSLLPTSSDESTILALGANDICTVKLLQNQSMGEVRWASHRKAIASLTLSGDGTSAKVTSFDGLSISSTFLFYSCLECLRFVQEFYGVKLPSVHSPLVAPVKPSVPIIAPGYAPAVPANPAAPVDAPVYAPVVQVINPLAPEEVAVPTMAGTRRS